MRHLFSFFLFSIIKFNLLAQPGWNWPENKAEAEEKNVLYTDYLKEGNCEAALEPHNWLLDSVPHLHVSLYQNGIKIYQCLIKNEKDRDKRNQLCYLPYCSYTSISLLYPS